MVPDPRCVPTQLALEVPARRRFSVSLLVHLTLLHLGKRAFSVSVILAVDIDIAVAVAVAVSIVSAPIASLSATARRCRSAIRSALSSP